MIVSYGYEKDWWRVIGTGHGLPDKEHLDKGGEWRWQFEGGGVARDNKLLGSLSSYFTVIAVVGNDRFVLFIVLIVDTAAATSPWCDFQIIFVIMSWVQIRNDVATCRVALRLEPYSMLSQTYPHKLNQTSNIQTRR